MKTAFPDRLLAVLPALTLALMAAGLAQKARLPPRAGPAQCMQRGALDTPASLAAAGLSFGVTGWAYDRLGIREVQAVYAGRIVARQRTGTPRPDVSAALAPCPATARSGFSLNVPAGVSPAGGGRYEIRAVDGLGRTFRIGEVALRFERPLGYLNAYEPIRWNGDNVVSGWALARGGAAEVRILAQGRELAHVRADLPREDIPRVFPAWPAANRSGFQAELSMRTLPRGRYPLTLRLEAPDGARTDIAGPEVINDAPLGKVAAAADRLTDPREIALEAWAYAEDGIESARLETEEGVALAPLRLKRAAVTLGEFERAAAGGQGNAALRGAVYDIRLPAAALPPGLHRLEVRLVSRSQRTALVPGPLVRSALPPAAACAGAKRRLYYPGNHKAFRHGFPRLDGWRALADGGCLEIGIRGRVEYLRTTHGRGHDYAFDPDFPDAGRLRNGREMTGVSLRSLLDLALAKRAPLLITLDGGVWAGMSFSDPEIDAADMLKESEAAVQWNQHGRSEAGDALRGLAGSLDDPLLARMLSYNRYNTRYRDYKKRNLQAAVGEILRFARAHPDIDVTINLDPDVYINPWFNPTQWYDYNPDTLRQFREWLFHLGPYADGGSLARARHEPRLALADARRIGATDFSSLDAVEPPRGPIDYDDPWQQIWSQFRRHLVAQHYEDLAAWAAEAGLPPDKIYSAQAFIQADIALGPRARATGWTDQAGVSIAGAKPSQGHLGATLYGPSSRNLGRPREGVSLIDNLRSVDPDWGALEFHPATIARPDIAPTHAEAYRTLLAIINGGARFLSPMWGSRAEEQRLHPEKFRAYDLMEGSAFEYQLAWWLLELQALPRSSLLFPFGNAQVDSADGWSGEKGTRVSAERGRLRIAGDAPALASPVWDGLSTKRQITVEARGAWPQRRLTAEIRLKQGGRLNCVFPPASSRCTLPTRAGDRLERVVLEWSGKNEAARGIVLDEVQIDLE